MTERTVPRRAANLPAALAAVEAAGYTPDALVASRSALAARIPGATPAAYPAVAVGPTGSAVYVVASAAVLLA